MSELSPFHAKLSSYQRLTEDHLSSFFLGDTTEMDPTKEAAIYSLTAGGKRIRPALLLATAEMLHLRIEDVLPFAVALEMIHTYSLIHDDLPCMDNDVLRRGKPTCHVKFGEAIALLAGDALLNRAYEVVLQASLTLPGGALRAALFLASMAGSNGMIGGQTIDILSEGKRIDKDHLLTLHRKKTGCLLRAPVMIPYLMSEYADTNENLGHNLEEFSSHIGLAFQIKDDLLDVTSTDEVLGKSVGKDAIENKSTFVTLFGISKAKEYLQEEITAAYSNLNELDKLGFSTSFLANLTDYLFTRDH